MRPVSYGFLSVLMVTLLTVPLLAVQNGKLTVAVLDLDPTGITKSDAQFLSDRFRTELFETGKFQIVEREKMNEILVEQGFQQSGCTSVECAVEIGQLLNVQVMVAGNIGKIEDLYSISIRMIDVSSGAIIRTATKDYEGRLSDVLTDVVPEIAQELASAEYGGTNRQPVRKAEGKQTDQSGYKKFEILLEAGFSSLTYTNDINKEIEKLNANLQQDIEELGAFFPFGLEIKYRLSASWKLKLSFLAENPLSDWKMSARDEPAFDNAFSTLEIERTSRYVNMGLGIDYILWHQPEKYEIYLGLDLGSTALSSELRYNYTGDGAPAENSETFKYSSFTTKISAGGLYYFGRSVSGGILIQFKSVKPFDLSDEAGDQIWPEEILPIFFPKELNASGLVVTLCLGFHF